MTGTVLRAGAWPAIVGLSGVAVVLGGCGAAFPAAASVLLPICFALLGAAATFTLDEPASLVVDVTPTGPVRRGDTERSWGGRAFARGAQYGRPGGADCGGGAAGAGTGAGLPPGQLRVPSWAQRP